MYFRNVLSHGIFCWCLALLLDIGESLKDLRVSVPQAIRKGETAVLMCDFDLEGDSLYSVKWYKGRREFYRFTPKDEFPIKTFPIGKVNVDKSKSNMTQLTLIGVDPSLSGVYNCEVSAESPSFHTELKSGEMNVVETPSLMPVLTGLKSRYGVGETLEANCISGGSRPAANLTWFLNGEKVHRDHMWVTTTTIKDNRQLLVSKSRLKFVVKTHSFKSGKLKLRCSASIHNVYNQAIEIDIDEEKPKAKQGSTQVVILTGSFLEKGDAESNNRHPKARPWKLQLALAMCVNEGLDIVDIVAVESRGSLDGSLLQTLMHLYVLLCTTYTYMLYLGVILNNFGYSFFTLRRHSSSISLSSKMSSASDGKLFQRVA